MLGLFLFVLGIAFLLHARVMLKKLDAREAAPFYFVAAAALAALCVSTASSRTFGDQASYFIASQFGLFVPILLWLGIAPLAKYQDRALAPFTMLSAVSLLFSSFVFDDLFGRSVAFFCLVWALMLFLLSATHGKTGDARIEKIVANLVVLVCLITLAVPGYLLMARLLIL